MADSELATEESASMPDGRTNRLQPEMYLTYSQGVNAAAQNHREMGPGQLRHLVNGTVRGGWVQTRPAFEFVSQTFETEQDQLIFETGKVQGSAYYQFGRNSVIVYAIDGNLFAVDPADGTTIKINPKEGKPFSRHSHFVYFCQRAGYLISGDGVSLQVVTKGYESRFANPRDPANEVPTGLMMADGWGRLAIVDPDRRRIRFSNHEMDPDPGYLPLGFQESFDYYLSTKWFQVPDHIGKIVWIGFVPALNSPNGTGPLAVMGDRGTQAYDVRVDRTQWKTQNISETILPNIGAIAHRAQVVRNDNLIFTDQFGRIRHLKQADRSQQKLTVDRFDRPVYPYYEREPTDLRAWRMAVNWDQRIITTIQPESRWICESGIPDRFNIRHRGLAVWNGEVTEETEAKDIDVWDGIWTGIYPTAINTGLFCGDSMTGQTEKCIVLSNDSDGINRLYSIRKDGESRYDVSPDLAQKRIEMQLVTRQFDFSARDTDYSLLLKRIDRAVIRIGERYGSTKFTGSVLSDQEFLSRPWFTHRTTADHSLMLGETLTAGRPQQDSKLQLPSDQAEGENPVSCANLKHFYKCNVHLRISGWARIEELALYAKKQIQQHTANTTCEYPEARRNIGCSPALWEYDIGADEIEP